MSVPGAQRCGPGLPPCGPLGTATLRTGPLGTATLRTGMRRTLVAVITQLAAVTGATVITPSGPITGGLGTTSGTGPAGR